MTARGAARARPPKRDGCVSEWRPGGARAGAPERRKGAHARGDRVYAKPLLESQCHLSAPTAANRPSSRPPRQLSAGPGRAGPTPGAPPSRKPGRSRGTSPSIACTYIAPISLGDGRPLIRLMQSNSTQMSPVLNQIWPESGQRLPVSGRARRELGPTIARLGSRSFVGQAWPGGSGDVENTHVHPQNLCRRGGHV